MIVLHLTCANDHEARDIAEALLMKKLIVCARRCPIQSSYWWDNKIQHGNEVLLMMESIEKKFDEINETIASLHSYNEYVLTSFTVSRTTPGVERWLNVYLT